MTSVATASRSEPERASPAPGAGPIAWVPNRELDATEWAAAGRRIGTVGRCIQWVLGDWIAYGNEKFGERYARASKITGYDTQTLMNMVYVASRFSISRRRENLSWSHHETLAALSLGDQDQWLDRASTHRWSVADLRMMLRLSRKEEGAVSTEAQADDSGSPSGKRAETPSQTTVVECPRCGEKVPLSPQ